MIMWTKKTNPAVILARIRDCATVRDGDKIEYAGFEIYKYEADLLALISWPDSVARGERRGVLAVALRECLLSSTLNEENLLPSIREVASRHVSHAPREFIFVTSMTIPASPRIRWRRNQGVQLSFPSRVPARFARSREILRPLLDTGVEPWPLGFAPVLVKGKAKSPLRAGEAALDALDLLRAMWNLALNRRVAWRFPASSPRPLNTILLGPVSTLHRPEGSLETESYWRDPMYPQTVHPSDLGSRWDELLGTERWVRRHLRSVPYRSELEAWLRQYCRALDQVDPGNAFLQLWSLLERLSTPANQYAEQKVVVQRVLFLYKDKDYHREVLGTLRRLRNDVVHYASPADDQDFRALELKGYVESLLLFHLGRGARFETLEQACEFLDLTQDVAQLDSEIKLRRFARKHYVA